MTAVGVLAAAVPAQAGTPTYSAEQTTTEDGHTLVQKAVGQVLQSTATSRTIAITCSALALPDGAGTGVKECYLLGADGRRYAGTTDSMSSSGPADTAAAVVTVPQGTYRLCMRSNALFMGGSYALSGPTICSAPA